jgi:putative ABC transport system permease protein
MKAYIKTILRMLRKNMTRAFSIILIIGLGVGFVSGLGSVPPNLRGSTNKYMHDNVVPDIIVKSNSQTGISESQVSILTQHQIVKDNITLTSIELMIQEMKTRVYYQSLNNNDINKLTLISGNWPQNANEVLVERKSEALKEYNIGDKIIFNNQELTVVGIAANPLLFSKRPELSMQDQQALQLVMYFDIAYVEPPIITDMYIKLNNSDKYNIFSNAYKDYVNESISQLKASFNDETLVYLTLQENMSMIYFTSIVDKIEVLVYIFPIFFILVVILVVLSTMTRLVEEERSLIGCYKTLGYSDSKVVFKYLFFAFLCSFLGGLLGVTTGNVSLMPIIYNAFDITFHLLPPTGELHFVLGIVVAVIMLISAMAITLFVIKSLLKENPASLLLYKAPKPGKKIFLERILFIWSKLKFKYKSTFRNIFRFVRHFIMTVVSTTGSTALVLAGLGLYDTTRASNSINSFGMFDSIKIISITIIICAAILSILVTYNLTNMNIDERQREIATLKVLGYKDMEVAGYIYREIFILTMFGLILGLPVGYFFLRFVLDYVEFGSINDMKWYSWILTCVISILFILIVDLLLYRKIIKTDMNASLKTIE